MTLVAGYALQNVAYDVEGYLFHRAVRASDGAEFLAKSPSEEFPPLQQVMRLDRELQILRARPRPVPGVLQPLFRIDQDRTSYLILDHFPGVPLTLALSRGLSITDFSSVARGLCETLAACHEQQIAHLRLTPGAVLYDSRKRTIRLTHFGHAEPIDGLRTNLGHTEQLTLCSAPEQTGRMDRAVDHRADLYALGCILYYLLTRTFPFEVEDRHELVHSLVAIDPEPVTKHRSDVPAGVSNVIARLLAKDPDDRYQSAVTVAQELEYLGPISDRPRSGIRSSSRPPDFEARQLLGRGKELASLRAVAAETARGALRIVNLRGPAGSGKSRLLSELKTDLRAEGHLVLAGKFSQYQRNAPYRALLDIVGGFVEQALVSPEPELRYWKQRLSGVPSRLRAVLVEHISKLQFLLGAQEPAPALGPTENQNRFDNAIDSLTDALCDRSHPLVLLLDDCHWADEASLGLLRRMFVGRERSHLLLVLASRVEDAGAAPADLAAEFATASGGMQISLPPLEAEDIRRLCTTALDRCHDVTRLEEAVFRRSKGNPLFAIELLKAFYRDGALRRPRTDNAEYTWEFVGSPDTTIPASQDVVTLIVQRIARLRPACHQLLKTAACFGGSIPSGILQDVVALPVDQFRAALDDACAEGLLQSEPGGSDVRAHRGHANYRFVHDRVEQAARSLCSAEELEDFDYRIGLALWQAAKEPSGDEAFAIAEHLNRVHRLDAAERERLIELNLSAGRTARATVAYRAAAELFRAALDLLTRDTATRDRQFEIRKQLAECHYLCSDFSEAERLFDELVAGAVDTDKQIEIYRTRMVLYLHMQRYREAISVGLQALKLLGLRIPENPSALSLLSNLASVMRLAKGRSAIELINRPDRATHTDRRILDILILLWTPSFWINQRLNALIGLTLTKLTLRLGNTIQAPMAYACFGVLNHIVLKRYERAIEMGELAAKLAGSRPDPFVACRVDFITLTFSGPFQRTNRENVEHYEAALARCLQAGEHVFAGCCIDGISTSVPMSGFRLTEIASRLDSCLALARRIGSTGSATLVALVRKWCDALSLEPRPDLGIVAVAPSEHEAYTGFFELLQLSVDYLWGADAAVLAGVKRLRKNQIVQSNPLHAAFYDLFAILAHCRSLGGRGPKRLPRSARRSLERLERFSALHPENFRPSLLLARAEIARVRQGSGVALELYHQAIEQAAALDHHMTHAIACERLAAFYDALGDAARSAEYVRIAAYSYGRWGALAKVHQLAGAYPNVSSLVASEGAAPTPDSPGALNAEAVMRASYAIAEETGSDRLTEKLLRVLTTSAGAQRGFLIKEHDGAPWILAGWDVERKDRPIDEEPLAGSELLAESVVRFVLRTGETVHLANATSEPMFHGDPHVQRAKPKAILCVPLTTRGSVIAVIYLENRLSADVFSEGQRKLVTMLGHQAAIALNNADYHRLQMEALQAKVNPHLLYNALSTIAELIVTDPERAETAVLKLAQLYRYMLAVSPDHSVDLEEELNITKAYLLLEKLRFGDKLDYEIVLSGDPTRVRVPPLIVQPLVENSVKHGIAPKLNGGRVCLSVRVEATDCVIRVEDDGLGWGEGVKGTGVGLRSIRERLSLLFGRDFSLTIEENDGVVVTIKIPVSSKLLPGSATAIVRP